MPFIDTTSTRKLTISQRAHSTFRQFEADSGESPDQKKSKLASDSIYMTYFNVSEEAYKLIVKSKKKNMFDKDGKVLYKASGNLKIGKHKFINEHSFPNSLNYKLLTKEYGKTVKNEKDMEKYIKKYCVCCLITKEEDNKLNAAGLKAAMPKNWNHEKDSILARYDAVGIKMHF